VLLNFSFKRSEILARPSSFARTAFLCLFVYLYLAFRV